MRVKRVMCEFVALLITCPLAALAAGWSGPSYLPVLVLHASKPILNRNRVPIHAWLIDYSGEAKAFGPVVYDGRAEASVRGNTSFHFDKKSYRLELQTSEGDDNKVSLLGMPAESDWVLYGCGTDASFLRTVLAHDLWRQMGYYAVRWRFVEVFMVLTRCLRTWVALLEQERDRLQAVGQEAGDHWHNLLDRANEWVIGTPISQSSIDSQANWLRAHLQDWTRRNEFCPFAYRP